MRFCNNTRLVTECTGGILHRKYAPCVVSEEAEHRTEADIQNTQSDTDVTVAILAVGGSLLLLESINVYEVMSLSTWKSD